MNWKLTLRRRYAKPGFDYTIMSLGQEYKATPVGVSSVFGLDVEIFEASTPCEFHQKLRNLLEKIDKDKARIIDEAVEDAKLLQETIKDLKAVVSKNTLPELYANLESDK